MTRCIPLLLALTALPAAAGGFHAWGKLEKYKKTESYALGYKAQDGRRLKSEKAWVSLGEGVRYFQDRRIPMEAIKEGDTIYVHGALRETQGRTPEGTSFTDRQLANTTVILLGEGFPTLSPAGKDDVGWRQATVVRNGGSLTVSLGAEYKVSCTRDVVILRREALSEVPELKKKLLAEVKGRTQDERPEHAKDDELAVSAEQIVLLDPKAQAAYLALLPPSEQTASE